MSKGFAELQRSALAFFRSQRHSRVSLVFTATETFEYELLRPSQRTVAFACERCETVVLTVQPWLP